MSRELIDPKREEKISKISNFQAFTSFLYEIINYVLIIYAHNIELLSKYTMVAFAAFKFVYLS